VRVAWRIFGPLLCRLPLPSHIASPPTHTQAAQLPTTGGPRLFQLLLVKRGPRRRSRTHLSGIDGLAKAARLTLR
jgi:hypothetical protein